MAHRPKNGSGASRIELTRSGLRLGSETVPLWAGSVHYWRLDPKCWRAALEATKKLGFRLIDTYIPWNVHETAPGEIDLTGGKPRRDVVRFLELVHELGLHAIVRPGPHVNSELTFFGVPERVVWDADCQARTSGGKPVVLPVPPLSFPVPSYASEAFHTEVSQWLGAVARALAPLRWPDGPIVLVQVDNEGAMYFRDGVYDQDYHPDAIVQYRRFLQHKYVRIAELRRAHQSDTATFAKSEPPRRFDAESTAAMTPHLDWAEFQEHLLATSLGRMAKEIARSGLDGVPTTHNLPPAEAVTPLDPARVGEVVDLVGLDYYHTASEPQRLTIARRTSELVTRSEARNTPAFAAELGVGFPPFLPPLTHRDNAFTALTALAHGLRGFNAYMAVDRDRWIGAPLDRRGARRDTAAFWESLLSALERARFHELERQLPVRIVVPRVLRRVERVLHAFGPISAAALALGGVGPEVGGFENDLGLEASPAPAAAALAGALEVELDARGVPYAFVGGDLLEAALREARWVIVLSGGALEPSLVKALAERSADSAACTLGPLEPAYLSGMDLPAEVPVRGAPQPVPRVLTVDSVSDAVELAIDALDLPTFRPSPSELRVTVHHDGQGRPAVMFVLNGTAEKVSGRVPTLGAVHVSDAFDGSALEVSDGQALVDVPPRSVRMLALGPHS